jgi:hypothetical protein
MDPDTSWQGSPAAAPRKAVEAEHVAASRSYVQREGDDARGGRVRDAIIEVARAMKRRGQNPNVLDRENVEAARDCRDPDHLDSQGPERA